MRRLFITVLILCLCAFSVNALESGADESNSVIDGLPSEVSELMDEIDTDRPDFIKGFMEILLKALGKATDGIRQGLRLSAVVLMICLLCGIWNSISSHSSLPTIVGVLGIYAAVLGAFGSMIQLSKDTVATLTDYSALLIPIMASAAALSGNPVSATVLQSVTVLFAQLLMRIITKLLIPGVYLFLALAAGEAALQNNLLGELREFLSWIISKTLRCLMYIFTVFLTLSGVISGNTDAMAVKTAKFAVSGMIPVVGSILSDASESLLAGASILKNTVGIVGMLAVFAAANLGAVAEIEK